MAHDDHSSAPVTAKKAGTVKKTPTKKAPTKSTAVKAAAATPRKVAAKRGMQASTTARTSSRQTHLDERRQRGATHQMRVRQSKLQNEANKALVAAAKVLDNSASAGGTGTSASRTWQHAAQGYTRNVPELGAAKMYIGNCMSRIKLKVGHRRPDGSVDDAFDGADPIEDVDNALAEEAGAIIASIRSPIGGQAELLRSFGEKMFIVGEMYLLPADTLSGVTYSALSIEELQKQSGKWQRFQGPGADTIDVPDGIEPIRIWRPDDVFENLPTASTRACLEVLEELVILTRLVRSSAISRLALSGILAIADEFDEPDDPTAPEGEQQTPLLIDIIMNGAKAIDDPASASSWLPYLLSGPLELIKDGIKLIEFNADDSVNVIKRGEALERLAHGLDCQAEVVLGHAGTTFANAGQISEDQYELHVQPMAQMFDDACTLGILWPTMAANRGLTADQVAEHGYPEDILTVCVTHDASELVARPDRAKDILELYLKDKTQSAIAITEVREALGVAAEGGPDVDETQRRIHAIQLTQVRETLTEGQTEPTLTASGVRGDVTVLATKISAGADLTLERCADKVGAKVRNKAEAVASRGNGHGDLALKLAGVANGDVTRELGSTVCKQLLGGDDPTRGELSVFERSVVRWAADVGISDPGHLAKLTSEVVATAIVERLYGSHRPELDADVLAMLIAIEASAAA